MLRFGDTKVTNAKKIIKILMWAIQLVKTKTNSKYLIGYLDKAIRPLVLIMPKMSGNVKIFKVKDGDEMKEISSCLLV